MLDIVLLGLNHKTAPVALRECIAISKDETAIALKAFQELESIREVMLFSTCNRVEVLMIVQDKTNAVNAVKDFLSESKHLPVSEFEKFLLAKPADAEVTGLLSKAYFQKALIDYNKGEFMAAKKGFESALEHNSNCEKCTAYVNQSLFSFKDVHYNKGVVYYGKQQLAEAVNEWEQVYELDPEYKDVAQNLKKAKDLLAKLEKIKKSRQP